MKRHALITVFALGLLALFCGICNAQSPHADVVATVKNELLARGESLAGPCGAFKITREVGYRLRNEGWGYVHSEGNGCEIAGDRLRADTLMQPNGYTVDLLSRSESDNGDTSNNLAFNLPAWGETGPQSPANWRQPFSGSPMVAPPVLPPPPAPPVVVTSPVDLTGVYTRIQSLSDRAERIYADMVARDTARAAQVKALDDHLTAHDTEPSWVRKFFTNSTTLTALISGLSVFLAQQAAQ